MQPNTISLTSDSITHTLANAHTFSLHCLLSFVENVKVLKWSFKGQKTTTKTTVVCGTLLLFPPDTLSFSRHPAERRSLLLLQLQFVNPLLPHICLSLCGTAIEKLKIAWLFLVFEAKKKHYCAIQECLVVWQITFFAFSRVSNSLQKR